MTALGDFSAGDVLTAADLNAIGTWSDFTPNVRPSGGSFTSVSVYQAKYAQINDVVIGVLIYKITNVGTGSGVVVTDLPVAMNSDYFTAGGGGFGVGRENWLNGYMVSLVASSSTVATVHYYDNSNTVANGSGAGLTFVYRAA